MRNSVVMGYVLVALPYLAASFPGSRPIDVNPTPWRYGIAFCIETGVSAGRMPCHESGARLPTIRLHMRFVGLLYEKPPLW